MQSLRCAHIAAAYCSGAADNISSTTTMTTPRRNSVPAAASSSSASAASAAAALIRLNPIQQQNIISYGDTSSVLELATNAATGRVYKETFSIRCYEASGPKRAASIETIANLLQEAACNHARSVGFSTEGFATTSTMRQHGLIWVTTRMHIEIEDYPRWGDEVEVATWFQFEGRIGTRRDWVMRDVKQGRVLARATSTWGLMNRFTRRLSRANDDVKNEFSLYVMDPPRWAFPTTGDGGKKKQICKLEDYEHVKLNSEPRRNDLDMNNHVNNVAYFSWVLESVPEETLEECSLRSITLEFRCECQKDDRVVTKASPVAATDDGCRLREFTHLLELAQGNREVNRARTVWSLN